MARPERSFHADRNSKLLGQSALVVALYFFIGGDSSDEVIQIEQQHADVELLRSEREVLRESVYAANQRAEQAERERDELLGALAVRSELDSPPRLVKASPETKKVSLPRAGDPVVEKIARLDEVQATGSTPRLGEDSGEAKFVAILPPALEDSREKDEPHSFTMRPGRIAFEGKVSERPKSGLSLDEDQGEIKTVDRSRRLLRSFADYVWYDTVEEMRIFECGSLRGASLEKCHTRLDQLRTSHGPMAVDCVMSGNARPDYVHGLDVGSIPSHAVRLDQGALILCDSELSNQQAPIPITR